jgi:hypothetical protein
MTIVRRSSHRWWISLVTIAGAMATPADASAREMGCKGTCDLARGMTRRVSETRSPEGLVLEQGRSVTPLRMAAQACSGPWADAFAMPHAASRCADAGRKRGIERKTGPSGVGIDRSASNARSDGRSTLRLGRRARLRIDAEDWEDRFEEDDDSDLPVRVWLRDIVRCSHELIVPECNSRFPSINTRSAFWRLSQQLRC